MTLLRNIMKYERIPAPIDMGKQSDSCMSFLAFHYKEFLEIKKEGKLQLVTDDTGRFVCGFPVPDFQRPLVWTLEQEILFIESAWLGLPLGSFTIHTMNWGDGGVAHKFSGWVIDGQQRLHTIERYWSNEFKVFGLYWSELNRVEKRRFESIKFTHTESDLWDEAKIRDLYNRLALGGTPHTEDQRA